MKKLDRLTITSNEQSKLIDPPTVLIGNTVRDSPPPQEQTEGIRIDGDSGSFWLTEEILSRGLLNIGSTGSGKTNLIYSISSAILGHLKDNEIVVFFDYKGDYFNAFFDKHNPNHIVISTQDKHKPYSRSWNLFGELFGRETIDFSDDNVSGAALEISAALFKSMESQQQPFFHIAARDICRMIWLYFLAEAQRTGDYSRLNNESLGDFFDNAVTKDLCAIADKSGFSYIRSYLGNPSSPTPQSLGVEGFLHAMCSSQFIGSFRRRSPNGDFSMRRLVREKGAKVVFLEFDIARGKTLSPIYSLLFDLAIKEQLSVGEGNLFLIADELYTLPYAERLGEACNAGRSKGLKMIAGIQSIDMLYDNYGEAKGKSIAAGFVNVIAFKAVDYTTREWFSERIGKTFEAVTFGGRDFTHEGFTVSDADIHNLQVGEAFCDIFGLPPFRIRFKKYGKE